METTYLYEFPQSHFCEKVRWALDYKSIPWQSKRLIPGHHRMVLKKIAPETSLPVLVQGDRVIQGSHQIISDLDERYPKNKLLLGDLSKALSLESQLDEKIGNPLILSVYYYLFDYPELINPYYMKGLSLWKRKLFSFLFPVIKKRAVTKYGINESTHQKCLKQLREGLNWLDEELQDSEFLSGESFSRTDIAAATILSIIDRSTEHPYQWDLSERPREVLDLFEELKEHRCFAWGRELYSKYRTHH